MILKINSTRGHTGSLLVYVMKPRSISGSIVIDFKVLSPIATFGEVSDSAEHSVCDAESLDDSYVYIFVIGALHLDI